MEATLNIAIFMLFFCGFFGNITSLSYPPYRYSQSVNATVKQEATTTSGLNVLYACAFDLPQTIAWRASVIGILFSRPVDILKYSEYAQTVLFEDPGHQYYVLQNTWLNTTSSNLHAVFVWAVVSGTDIPSAVCSIQIDPASLGNPTNSQLSRSTDSSASSSDVRSISLSHPADPTTDPGVSASPIGGASTAMSMMELDMRNALTTEIRTQSVPRGDGQGRYLLDVYCDLQISQDVLEPGQLRIELTLNRPVMEVLNWDFQEINVGMSSTNYRFTNDALFSASQTPHQWEFQIKFIYFGVISESGTGELENGDPNIPRGTCRYWSMG